MSKCRVICMFYSLLMFFKIRDLNSSSIVLTDALQMVIAGFIADYMINWSFTIIDFEYAFLIRWYSKCLTRSRESIAKLRDQAIPLRELVPEQFILWNSLLNKLGVSLPSADCKWRLSVFITTGLVHVLCAGIICTAKHIVLYWSNIL